MKRSQSELVLGSPPLNNHLLDNQSESLDDLAINHNAVDYEEIEGVDTYDTIDEDGNPIDDTSTNGIDQLTTLLSNHHIDNNNNFIIDSSSPNSNLSSPQSLSPISTSPTILNNSNGSSGSLIPPPGTTPPSTMVLEDYKRNSVFLVPEPTIIVDNNTSQPITNSPSKSKQKNRSSFLPSSSKSLKSSLSSSFLFKNVDPDQLQTSNNVSKKKYGSYDANNGGSSGNSSGNSSNSSTPGDASPTITGREKDKKKGISSMFFKKSTSNTNLYEIDQPINNIQSGSQTVSAATSKMYSSSVGSGDLSGYKKRSIGNLFTRKSKDKDSSNQSSLNTSGELDNQSPLSSSSSSSSFSLVSSTSLTKIKLSVSEHDLLSKLEQEEELENSQLQPLGQSVGSDTCSMETEHRSIESKLSDSSITLELPSEQPSTSSSSSTPSSPSTQPLTEKDRAKLSLERQLLRRKTVDELKLDKIIDQQDLEDVDKEQKQRELRKYKVFVGTRPEKKTLFYNINNNNQNNLNNLNTFTLQNNNNNNNFEEENESSLLLTPTLNSLLKKQYNDAVDLCFVLINHCNGWRREVDYVNSLNQTPMYKVGSSYLLEEYENEIKHYADSFLNEKHKNFVSIDHAQQVGGIGPVIISIKKEAEKISNQKRKKKSKQQDKENNSINSNNNSHNNNDSLSNLKSDRSSASFTSSPLTNGGSSSNLSISLNNSNSSTPILSMERKYRVIIRSQEGEDRFYLSSGKATPNELMTILRSFITPISNINFKQIKTTGEVKKLLQYWETAQMTKEYKFGILYRKNGQFTENEMFSNTESSPEYQEFLEFIGKKIELKGWSHFKGGLDVKNNTTGTHSVYTSKQFTIDDNSFKVQIMFHVSTLLPFYSHDQQQLERKRHIGNDIVVLVFQDLDCPPFKPSTIISEFNHVFVVVQPLRKEIGENTTRYVISVTSKEGCAQFGPQFSSTRIWRKDSSLLDHLLIKMINGEKAAFYAPSFSDKMKRTRLVLLKTALDKIDTT